MPMMNPNRLNDTAVSTKKKIIARGWAIERSTNSEAVRRMIVPIINPLVAAAPT
ncbi:hypothetical protein D3C78_1417620 [compost metagenome]